MTLEARPWPIFVLSLAGEEARRAPLLSALRDMGLVSEVLIGVDGRDGLPAWAERQVDRYTPHLPTRQMTDGELACALSHTRAYRKILTDGLPGAIIFEDDARLEATFLGFIQARVYERSQMVLLGHRKTWVRRSTKVPLSDEVDGYRVIGSPLLAHGYSVSRNTAGWLLRHALPIRAPADWPCDLSRIEVFASCPQLARQCEGGTASSHLEAERLTMTQTTRNGRRYLQGAYWGRFIAKRLKSEWWRKRVHMRIA